MWACNWHAELRFDTLGPFEIHMDREHDHWRDPEFCVSPCATCGVRALSTRETIGLSEKCMHCPSVACGDCGEPDDRTCSCWVSIEHMSLADKKALFAADGTFNIGVNGEVTTA